MTAQIVPALVARARRRIVADLEDRGATSPERAVAYEPENRLIARRVFGRMCQAGAVVEAEPGHYYLSRSGLDAYRASLRRRVGLVAGAAAVVAGLIALGG